MARWHETIFPVCEELNVAYVAFLFSAVAAEYVKLHGIQSGINHGNLFPRQNHIACLKVLSQSFYLAGTRRQEIFLETKLWPTFYSDENAVDDTLERLGTDYIDLMLLHQPAGCYLTGYRSASSGDKRKVPIPATGIFTPLFKVM